MKIIGNILWFVLGGFIAVIFWYISGLLLCITLIGIPFGLQLFKLAQLALWPFGKTVNSNFDKHPVMNVIWLITGGWESFLTYIVLGAIYCITIVGIPFGLQWFKLSKLTLLPFGASIK